MNKIVVTRGVSSETRFHFIPSSTEAVECNENIVAILFFRDFAFDKILAGFISEMEINGLMNREGYIFVFLPGNSEFADKYAADMLAESLLRWK